MKEVEVKAKIKNLEEVKEKLQKLGCVFSKPLIQKDKIYLHKNTMFQNVTKGKVILRIRDSNGIFIITLKKQLENELDNIEREVIVNDPIEAEEILKEMDYKEVIIVFKKRVKCKYKDLEICLDNVEGLGEFIEVEKLTKDEESLKIQKELFEFLESLGIEKKDQVFKGYDTLLYEQQKN